MIRQLATADDTRVNPDPSKPEPVWNLYLREIRPGILKIVMPNPVGELTERPGPSVKTGFLMRWPVNPHFSGELAIVRMLRSHEFFASVRFVDGNNQTIDA